MVLYLHLQDPSGYLCLHFHNKKIVLLIDASQGTQIWILDNFLREQQPPQLPSSHLTMGKPAAPKSSFCAFVNNVQEIQ